MTSPNVLQLVADFALTEADGLEDQAEEWETKARDARVRAAVLRQLYQVAEPFARKSSLGLVQAG